MLACAVALCALTQVSQAVILDDFNVNEGHFNVAPDFSGTTVGEDNKLTTADRVTTDSPLEGLGHQKLVLVHTNDTANTPFRLRHLSALGQSRTMLIFRPRLAQMEKSAFI